MDLTPKKLVVNDLVKSYQRRRVVDQVNLEVEQGQIVGLLGPNGAGKSTTFYSIIGIIRPDEGTVLLERRGHHQGPHVSQSQKGHHLFAPGTIGVPQAYG